MKKQKPGGEERTHRRAYFTENEIYCGCCCCAGCESLFARSALVAAVEIP